MLPTAIVIPLGFLNVATFTRRRRKLFEVLVFWLHANDWLSQQAFYCG